MSLANLPTLAVQNYDPNDQIIVLHYSNMTLYRAPISTVAGAVGPPGSPGATGATGPAGAVGPAGAAFAAMGLLSARGAATTAGKLYYATDEKKIYFSDGTAWQYWEMLGGAAADNDAETYIGAVTAAGGTLTGAQQDAVRAFVSSLKTGGVWGSLKYLNVMLGGFAGCFTNLKHTGAAASVNTGFVASDYSAAGLKRVTGSKHVGTGQNIAGLDFADFSMGVWVSEGGTADVVGCLIGSSFPATGAADRLYLLGRDFYQVGLFNVFGSAALQGAGLVSMVSQGTNVKAYKNGAGTDVGTVAGTPTMPQSGTIRYMSGAGDNPCTERISAAYVASALSAAQLSTLTSALAALNASR